MKGIQLKIAWQEKRGMALKYVHYVTLIEGSETEELYVPRENFPP